MHLLVATSPLRKSLSARLLRGRRRRRRIIILMLVLK
jgi:hypothetical protein